MKKVFVFLFILIFLMTGCGAPAAQIIAHESAITWWCPNRYNHVGNMADSAVYGRLMEETGVDVAFAHPPQGEHRERLLALLGEEKLPDIITHDFVGDYPGGAEKALADGIIVPLNDIIETYCPNLSAYLDAHPEIKKKISTKDGRVFCFPSVQAEREIRTYIGPYIRTDYLDAVGMDQPETVAEYKAVLTALKQQLGVSPLSFYGGKIMDTDFLIGAYGLSWGFFVDEGQVRLGPLEENFLVFIEEFKAWYDAGLISPGVFTDSQKTYTAKAMRGDTGIYVDYVTNIERYAGGIDGASFAPLKYPVRSKGDKAFSGHIAPVFVPYASCYISPDNKDIEATARLLDYAYSAQGGLLYNFGIEGESYTMESGQPVYLPSVLNAPEGFGDAVKKYLASGAYVRDPRQFAQMLTTDEQRQAVKLWSDTQAAQHAMPGVALSASQSEAVAAFNEGYKDVVITWLKDYFLSGSETTTVQELQETLMNLGAAQAIQTYQEALNEQS